MDPLNGRTAVVTGASSGFGKAIAAALVGAGATVIGVARGEANLERVRATLGDRFSSAAGDASDPRVAVKLIRTHRPSVVVLNAGARTPLQPIQDQTWEEFERNPGPLPLRLASNFGAVAEVSPVPQRGVGGEGGGPLPGCGACCVPDV